MNSFMVTIALLCQVHGEGYLYLYQEKCQAGLTKCVLAKHDKESQFRESWDYSIAKCVAERKP